MASRPVFLLPFVAFLLLLAYSSMASAAVIEQSFYVQNLTVRLLCQEQVINAVNGSLPGPTILAREGDNIIVHVFNKSPYNLSIHWHGIFQLLTPWSDGPEYATQCPILPGHNYTYNFTITGQEGTLWWHAHVSWLRATVYGGLIIRPRAGHSYPFRKPHREFPIILGEWWNANVIDVENEALDSGGNPNISDAYTINGKPGDRYPCSSKHMHKIKVVQGKTYLLRIVNAALNNQLFFKIAKHRMTVVAIDATYTEHYVTDVVVLGPGQTVDVLLTANNSLGSYYMAASPYFSAVNSTWDNTVTTGILIYRGSTSATPETLEMPAFNDTPTAHKFFSNLTSLVDAPHWVPVPTEVDEHMFIAFGMGLRPCANSTCPGALGQRFSASMNNESFQFPTKMSMLEALFYGESGIYTTDFPDKPPLEFDYTNPAIVVDTSLIFAPKSTKVKQLKYNATVEVVLQNTAFVSTENHPIHLHGFNFHVLAQGFGNYDNTTDREKFNLVNPQIRNTIGVPVGGWAVIRFTANNPGVWMMHCHLDVHLPWGLAMAFVVESGSTASSTLPAPPADLPQC